MSRLVRRDYRGVVDLPAVVAFAQSIWTPDHRWHIGDLAWDIGMTYKSGEDVISIWEHDTSAEICGVGWLMLPTDLSVVLGAPHAGLLDDIIAWAQGVAGQPVTITVLSTESWLTGRLEDAGYRSDHDGSFFLQMARDLADLPPVPAVPDGFAIRPVRADETAVRVELHRAVWTKSVMTDESFVALTGRWPYREGFDMVVTAPDGALVSYILGWYDEVNRVGEFEPVGTREDFRRMGLSRAVGYALMHAFRDAGGERAIVYARGDDDYPIPRQVYAAQGFAVHGRTVRYHPPMVSPSDVPPR